MVKSTIVTLILSLTPLQENKLSLELDTGCEFITNSGNRTVKHNKRVGGAKNSYHLKKDMALDLKKTGCTLSYKQIGEYAKKYFNGVVVYPNHIHVDMRPKPYFSTGKY